MKEFKARHGSNALGNGNGGASSAHVTPNATPRKSKARTPASNKRKVSAAATTRKAGYYNGDDDDDVYGKEEEEKEEVEEDAGSPTKKGKKSHTTQKEDVKREVKYEDEGY